MMPEWLDEAADSVRLPSSVSCPIIDAFVIALFHVYWPALKVADKALQAHPPDTARRR